MDYSPLLTDGVDRSRYDKLLVTIAHLRRENRCLRLLNASALETGKETFETLRMVIDTFLEDAASPDPLEHDKSSYYASPISPMWKMESTEQVHHGDGTRSGTTCGCSTRAQPLVEQRKRLDERLARLRLARKRRLDDLRKETVTDEDGPGINRPGVMKSPSLPSDKL